MGDEKENMENQTPETKPPTPFKSLAQIRRCDSMLTNGSLPLHDVERLRKSVDRDLMATDIDVIPWRVGALKPDDPDEAAQEAFRATIRERKATLAAAQAQEGSV